MQNGVQRSGGSKVETGKRRGTDTTEFIARHANTMCVYSAFHAENY